MGARPLPGLQQGVAIEQAVALGTAAHVCCSPIDRRTCCQCMQCSTLSLPLAQCMTAKCYWMQVHVPLLAGLHQHVLHGYLQRPGCSA